MSNNTTSISITRNSDGDIVETNPQAAAAPVSHGPQIRPDMGMTRVTLSGGKIESTGQQRTSINTADIVSDRIAQEPNSIIASARRQNGSPVIGELRPTDLVDVGGIEITVNQAIAQGYLGVTDAGVPYDLMNRDGVAEDAERQFEEQAPEVPAEVLSDSTTSAMQLGTAFLDETAAAQHLMRALDGDFDSEAFTRAVEAKTNGNTVAGETAAKYFDQAVTGIVDDLLEGVGLDSDDPDEQMDNWSALVDVLKGEDKAAYQNAMRNLIMVGNATDLVELINKIDVRTGMLDESTAAEAGLNTRKGNNGETLVQIADPDTGAVMWVSDSVARKLGYL